MKFINVPISVEAHKGVPRRLRWGRRIYTVRRLLDFWILQSRWWAREEKRVYFRLETDRGVVEVYRGGREGEEEEEETRGPRSGPTDGAKRSKGEKEWEETSKTHQGGHPPFVEGDTHTRELRQTESPYRPDAAALADRRFKKPDLARLDKPNLASHRAAPAAEDFQSAPMSHPCGTSSSDSSRRAAPRWVLSKIMD